MKKLTNLPIHIRKIPNSKHFFYDSKNGKYIHKSQIESYCITGQIIKPHWTNNYYGNS